MKVTAIIPDELIQEVQNVTKGKNITESITLALEAFLRSKKIEYVMKEVEREPFQFNEDFEPFSNRDRNRNR